MRKRTEACVRSEVPWSRWSRSRLGGMDVAEGGGRIGRMDLSIVVGMDLILVGFACCGCEVLL